MNKVLILAIAVLATYAYQAAAVDIVNEGDDRIAITVTDTAGTRDIDIEGGQIIENVCTICTIEFAEESVEVRGDQSVAISGGKLLVDD